MYDKDPLNETKALHTLWFALLSGMTGALHHKQLDVKNTYELTYDHFTHYINRSIEEYYNFVLFLLVFRAIEMLFKTLNLCGQHFDHELWEMVFLHVIIPAFGSAFPPSNRQLTQEVRLYHRITFTFSIGFVQRRSFFTKLLFCLPS